MHEAYKTDGVDNKYYSLKQISSIQNRIDWINALNYQHKRQ